MRNILKILKSSKDLVLDCLEGNEQFVFILYVTTYKTYHCMKIINDLCAAYIYSR